MLPGEQLHPHWFGDIQVHVSIPSANIYNLWIGQVLMNDLSVEEWHKFEYQIPAWAFPQFEGSFDDVRIHLAINTGNCPTDPILYLDNLQFTK